MGGLREGHQEATLRGEKFRGREGKVGGFGSLRGTARGGPQERQKLLAGRRRAPAYSRRRGALQARRRGNTATRARGRSSLEQPLRPGVADCGDPETGGLAFPRLL